MEGNMGFSRTVVVSGGNSLAINNALNGMSSSGGLVIVEAGSYTIDGSTNLSITVPSDVTLIGKGKVVLNVTARVPAIINADQVNGNTRIVISGFKIEINNSNYYNSKAIYLKNINNSLIINNYITCVSTNGCDANAIAISLEGISSNSASKGNIISQNTIVNFGYTLSSSNILYGYGIKLNSYCNENVIRNNYIKKCLCCIHIESSDRTIIANNIIYNALTTVSGGVIYRQGHNGLQIRNSNYCTAIGNQANSNCEHGIYVSDSSNCTIKGNSCNLNSGAGIKLNADVNSDGNTITGNVCCNNGSNIDEGKDGILFEGQNGGSSNKNVVFSNVCNNNYRIGIYEVSSIGNYNCIVGNISENNNTNEGNYDIIKNGASTIVYSNIGSTN